MIRRDPGTLIALSIAVAFSAVAVFVLLWFPAHELRSARAALRHKVANQAALAAYTIAPAIDFDDPRMVEEVLGGLARDSDFVGVSVRDPTGRTIASREEGAQPADVVRVEAPVLSADREVGRLSLTMSEARIHEENRAQQLAATGISLTIALLGLVVAILASRAVRRVAHLTEENVKARADRERAEVRSRFMSVLSHEIRTPLNGVLGIAEALSHRPLDPQSASLATSLLRSGHSLLALINDVLDVAKLESGRVEVEHAPFDPEEAALTVAETLIATARAKGLELIVDVAPEVPASVEGDRHRLQQVLTNLIGNALKFTDVGHVCVLLEWRAPDRLHVAVSDTGIGIPAEKHALVFEAFSQADASTTRRFGGTGLGLTICRELVGLMGGALTLQSAVGRGTTFAFDMTVTPRAAARPAASDSLPGELWVSSRSDALAELVLRHAKRLAIPAERLRDDEELTTRLGTMSGDRVVVRDAAIGLAPQSLTHALRAARQRRVRVLELASVLDEPTLPGATDGRLPKPFARSSFDALVCAGASEPSEALPAQQVALRPGARVLVADDDGMNRLVMELLLQRLGTRPEMVENGRLALERVQRAPAIDLVLIDGEMPDMDGFAALRGIRAWEAERGSGRTPILMVSAHASETQWPRARSAGADGYLAKPVRLETLVRLLSEHAPTLLQTPQVPSVAAPADEANLRDVFRSSTAETLGALGESVRNEDWTGAARHAHKLKGACLVYGAVAAAEAALSLEHALRDGARPEIVERVLALEIALHEV